MSNHSLDITNDKEIIHDTIRNYTSVPGTAYFLPSDENERHRWAVILTNKYVLPDNSCYQISVAA
jgi:hypothetical protein